MYILTITGRLHNHHGSPRKYCNKSFFCDKFKNIIDKKTVSNNKNNNYYFNVNFINKKYSLKIFTKSKRLLIM